MVDLQECLGAIGMDHIRKLFQTFDIAVITDGHLVFTGFSFGKDIFMFNNHKADLSAFCLFVIICEQVL